jgi:hypothetical protein
MLARRHVVTATAAQLPKRDAEPEYCGDHHEGSGASADDREGEPWVGVVCPATHLEGAPTQEQSGRPHSSAQKRCFRGPSRRRREWRSWIRWHFIASQFLLANAPVQVQDSMNLQTSLRTLDASRDHLCTRPVRLAWWNRVTTCFRPTAKILVFLGEANDCRREPVTPYNAHGVAKNLPARHAALGNDAMINRLGEAMESYLTL